METRLDPTAGMRTNVLRRQPLAGCAQDAAVPAISAAAAGGARAWRFLLLALASSWLLWWPAAGFVGAQQHSLANAAVLAGTLCITLAALFLLYTRDAAVERHVYWSSLFPARHALPVLLLAALLMPALAFLAAAGDALIGGRPVQAGPLAGGGLTPFLYVKTFAFGMLLGPLFEELGWRGYALAPLQRRYGARRGALALAAVHAIWHLPLFFLAGSAQYPLGFLTMDFWRFLIDVMVFDVIVAAFYVKARQSTLVAIVLHASFNISAALFALSSAGAALREGLAAVLCAYVLARGFPGSREPWPATHRPLQR